MNELKIFVERCVRPVILEESGKLRMRRELYAHAEQAYQQELARMDDPVLALQQTFKRMGEPKQITAELQSTVGTLERWTGRIDAVMQRPLGMPLWQYASRVTFWMGTPMVALLSLLLCASLLSSSWEYTEWRFLGALGICWLMNLFVFTLLYGKVFGVFKQENWTFLRVAEILGVSLTTGADVYLTGHLFTYFASGDTALSGLALFCWIALAVIAALAMVAASWIGMIQLRGLDKWRELDIDS